jgi:hypothetical protein
VRTQGHVMPVCMPKPGPGTHWSSSVVTSSLGTGLWSLWRKLFSEGWQICLLRFCLATPFHIVNVTPESFFIRHRIFWTEFQSLEGLSFEPHITDKQIAPQQLSSLLKVTQSWVAAEPGAPSSCPVYILLYRIASSMLVATYTRPFF